MKLSVFLIFTILTTLAYSQPRVYREISFADAFRHQNTNISSDYCQLQHVKIRAKYTGDIQKIIPERAKDLTRIHQECGYNSNINWHRGYTEIYITDKGQSYWVQLDKTIDDDILYSMNKSDMCVFSGRLITEHTTEKSTAYLIVEQIEKCE